MPPAGLLLFRGHGAHELPTRARFYPQYKVVVEDEVVLVDVVVFVLDVLVLVVDVVDNVVEDEVLEFVVDELD